MARTFPTAGLSPCDFYVDSEVPVAYFRHELKDTLDSALKTVEVITNVNLVSGGIIQGLNSTITLDADSSRGTTACAIYAKVDAGTSDTGVSGRMSVIEARLEYGISSEPQSNMSVLCLDFSNANTLSIMSVAHAAYIGLRERSTTQKMPNLFYFMDHEAAIGTLNASSIISTNTNTATHSIRFMVGTIPMYILCSNVAPA